MTGLTSLLVPFAVVLFSLAVHESAHAWTAARFGDPTAARLGRVSLNPVRHVDPLGTLLLPAVAMASGAPIIGWAKPAPVDPANLRQPRRDFLWIAAAGPASNLLLAAAASVVLRAAPVTPIDIGGVAVPVWAVAGVAFEINLLLAVFNMLPIPPLDGGNVLAGLLPEPLAGPFERLLRPWGFLILYALLLTGVLGDVILPVHGALSEWMLR